MTKRGMMSRRPGFAGAVPARRRAGGFVLVGVLVVVLLAAMLVMSLLFRMRAEEKSAAAGAAADQAWAAAMSGVREAMRLAARTSAGSLDWQDNPAVFYERFVCDDGADRWYFSVYSPGDPESGDVRYGLADEAGKLNVNRATEEMLGKLPGMRPLLTQALMDFLDGDDTARPEGAEQEYYDALPTPYKVFNGPLSTLDELLLVRGFTPQLLYGEDANLNFLLDPNENDADATWPPDNSDSRLDSGLYPLLTVSSYELNLDSEGFQRTLLNDPTDPVYTNDLPASVGEYIHTLRSNKVVLNHAADLLEATLTAKDASGRDVQVASGVGKEELPTVLDWFTTSSAAEFPGLVNINTASAGVLQTLPGVEEPLAASIISTRKGLAPEKRASIAWLYTEGLTDAETFKKLAPLLTARSGQFSFNVVGYGLPSGRYRVIQVVIDVAGARPVILYLRDLTRLGPPFRFDSASSGGGISVSAPP